MAWTLFAGGKDIAIDWGSRYCHVWDKKNGFNSYASQVWVDSKDQVQSWGNDQQAQLNRYKSLPVIKQGHIIDFNHCIQYMSYVLSQSLESFELLKPTVWMASSQWNQAELDAFSYILKESGAGKTHFVNQNLALAVDNNFDFAGQKSQCLLHLGNQMTLLSVISPTGFVLERNHAFGSQDLDRSIQAYLQRVYRLAVSINDVENIKKLLSADSQNTEIWGRDLVSDRIKNIEVNFREIWNQTKPLVEDLGNLVTNFIHELPEEVINDIVDNGIILSGGGCLFGKIRDYLQIKVGANVYLSEHPTESLIRGLQKIIQHKHEYLNSGFA